MVLNLDRHSICFVLIHKIFVLADCAGPLGNPREYLADPRAHRRRNINKTSRYEAADPRPEYRGNIEGISRQSARQRSRQALPRISTGTSRRSSHQRSSPPSSEHLQEYLVGSRRQSSCRRSRQPSPEHLQEHLVTKPPIFPDPRANGPRNITSIITLTQRRTILRISTRTSRTLLPNDLPEYHRGDPTPTIVPTPDRAHQTTPSQTLVSRT
jgi:hypothetical protein